MCTTGTRGALGGQESGPLELGLQIVVGHHVHESNPGPLQERQHVLLTDEFFLLCLLILYVWKPEDRLRKLVLFFHHVGSGALPQVLRFGSRALTC